MAANDILCEQGAAITWKDPSAGTAYKDLTLAALAATSGRMGEVADLGAKFARRAFLEVSLVNGGTAPAAGAIMEIYWAPSSSSTVFPGAVTGADADYPATVANNKLQLMLVGFFICANQTSNVAQSMNFIFDVPSRYGAPVVINQSAQSLNTSTGTSSLHFLTLTPINDEVA